MSLKWDKKEIDPGLQHELIEDYTQIANNGEQ